MSPRLRRHQKQHFGIVCGHCSGPLFMLTCHHATGSGHEWTLASICPTCRAVNWTSDGCLDCAAPRPTTEDDNG